MEARNGVRMGIRLSAFEFGAGALAKPVSNRHRNERNHKNGNACTLPCEFWES